MALITGGDSDIGRAVAVLFAREGADVGEGTPYGRPAQPEEVGPAYAFFASRPDSGFITGEVLSVAGGETRSGRRPRPRRRPSSRCLLPA